MGAGGQTFKQGEEGFIGLGPRALYGTRAAPVRGAGVAVRGAGPLYGARVALYGARGPCTGRGAINPNGLHTPGNLKCLIAEMF